jgi:hypothetical protein
MNGQRPMDIPRYLVLNPLFLCHPSKKSKIQKLYETRMNKIRAQILFLKSIRNQTAVLRNRI